MKSLCGAPDCPSLGELLDLAERYVGDGHPAFYVGSCEVLEFAIMPTRQRV